MFRSTIAPIIIIIILAGCGGSNKAADAGQDADASADADVHLCAADDHCEDGLFCTVDRCRPGEAASDARGCQTLGSPCASGEMCLEEARQCVSADCGVPDQDGDGHQTVACGGDDCDDSDADRFPGNAEVCDAAGHDEDCVADTLGGVDEDGDGAVSSMCCFADDCGLDCADGDANVHPDAREICNNIDDDCDATTDGISAFCPSGTCVDNRCRAQTWARTFGGGSGAEGIISIDTDDEGNIYLVVFSTSADGFPIGAERMRPGLALVSYSASGTFRWLYQIVEADLSDPTSFSEALMSSVAVGRWGEVLVVRNHFGATVDEFYSELIWLDVADGGELGSERHVPPAPWTTSLFLYPAVATHSGFVLMGTVGDGSTGSLYAEARRRGSLIMQRTLDIDSTGRPSGGAYLLSVHGSRVLYARFVAVGTEIDGVTIDPGFALIEMTPTLDVVSSRSFPDELRLHDAAMSSDGELVVVGRYVGDVTMPWGEVWTHTGGEPGFAFALSADGVHQWTRRDANAAYGFVNADGRGNFVVGGSFEATLDLGVGRWASTGDCDAYVATFNTMGSSAIEGRSFVGTGCEALRAQAVDLFGGTILGGDFTDRITLGGSTYASSHSGRTDAFLVRVSD